MTSWQGGVVGGADARSLRRAALARLVREVGADVAMFHGYARRRGGGALLVASAVAVGDAGRVPALEAFDGFGFAELETRLDDAAPFGAFASYVVDSVPERVARNFRALGVHAGLGANFASGGVVVGSVYAYRLVGRPAYSDRDLRVADRSMPELAAAFEAAAAREEVLAAHLPVALFTSEGTLRYAPEGFADIEPDVSALADAVRVFAAGGRDQLVTAGALHRLTRVQGPEGGLVCVHGCPVDPLPVHRAMTLSPARRRVAAMAADGATVPEIASALGRSQETVRTHLKHVYEVLGVGSRVELAAIVTRVWA